MSFWDDEAGYDLNDPKHPTFRERYVDAADLARKAAKENPRGFESSGSPARDAQDEKDLVDNTGYCEDFPCCGHEAGDCFGQKYGSDESIKQAVYDRLREDDGYYDDHPREGEE